MRAFEAALAASWAMDESALRAVLEIAERDHDVTPEALEAYRAKSLENAERASIRDGVAILNVEGPLFKKANLMTALSGATSYSVLMRDFQAAVDAPEVRAILLNVDSPGGEASGTNELAKAIAAARGRKPIVAYAGDLAASAGYWIASAADHIVIGEGAALGSIGVRAGYSDMSKRDEARGVKTIEFVSSQSPYKTSDPATEDGRSRIQARVDGLAQVFVEAVASNRGVSVAHVLDAFGKGDVLIGKAAIAAGMADEIGSFEGTLAALAAGDERFAISGRSTAARAAHQEDASMTPEELQPQIDAAVSAERTRADAEQAAAVDAATAARIVPEADGVESAVAMILAAAGITPIVSSAGPKIVADDEATVRAILNARAAALGE